MATFIELVDLIEADLAANAQSLIEDEVKDAVNRAIADYENTRFDFNEDRTTFNTVALQSEYPLDPTNAPLVLTLDQVQYLQAEHLYRLVRESYEWYIEALVNQTAQVGPSNRYTVFNRILFLYPQPDEITTLTISGVHRLLPSPLVADGDTNAWTNQGFQMIRARAKADLFANRLSNQDRAEFHQDVADDYERRLKGDLDAIRMADTIKPFNQF